MADVSLAILGLGRVGTSAGLALQRYNQQNSEHHFKVTGYDTSPDKVRQAQKMNAINETANRPENAAKNKDIILMTLPQAEVLAAYDLIKDDVRPGSVIIDFSTLKASSLQWAAKNLSSEVHMVGATPIINPKYLFEGTDQISSATDDYFDKGVMMLMPGVKNMKEAIKLSSDLSIILGSNPYFLDPMEHDALTAWTEALPAVLGVAYFHMLSKSQGWDDAQRLTNPAMGMLTHHLFDSHPDDLTKVWMDSGDGLVRALDDMILTLREFRTAIATKDKDGLASTLEHNSQTYEKWVNRRYHNRWQIDESLESDTPSFGDVMGNMFGSFLSTRLGRGKKDNN